MKVLIVGGNGYIGKALQTLLDTSSRAMVLVSDCNLLSRDSVKKFTNDISSLTRPNKIKFDVIFYLAAHVGGIGYTSQNQADIFSKNLRMTLNFYDLIAPLGEKIVQTSSACIYSDDSPLPLAEWSIGNGLPSKQVLGYGASKLMLSVLCKLHNNVANLVLTNVYGEHKGVCERFDERSHVTAALIKKFVDSGGNDITLWGDGSQTRDFVHVYDVAAALYGVAISPSAFGDFNIANGVEISIKNLSDTIAKSTGYSGNVIWDASKPQGVKRRWLSNKKAKQFFGWEPTINFETGLAQEVEWYKNLR